MFLNECLKLSWGVCPSPLVGTVYYLTYLNLLPTGLHYTHPILISHVDLSSFLKKQFHCVCMFLFSCDMQGSLLIERRKQVTITIYELTSILKFIIPDNSDGESLKWHFNTPVTSVLPEADKLFSN